MKTESQKKTSLLGCPYVRWFMLLALIACLFLATRLFDVKSWLLSVLEWCQELGGWGMLMLGIVYVIATVLFLPGIILTLGAGFIFGVFWGSITVSLASTTGACCAFLVGRTLARERVARKISRHSSFAAIDRAVGKEGFKIVLLTRLSPLFPFNLLNYAYGLTNVRFKDYALASWIGMIPGTIMYIYLGSALRSLTGVAAGEVEGGVAQKIFFWAGLIIAIIVAVFVTRVARVALKEQVQEENDKDPD